MDTIAFKWIEIAGNFLAYPFAIFLVLTFLILFIEAGANYIHEKQQYVIKVRTFVHYSLAITFGLGLVLGLIGTIVLIVAKIFSL